MATWPATLPQYVNQSSYSETILDPVIRTDMDNGPAKARLRYTAVPEQFQVSITLTKDQRAIFLAFFKSTLHYGVDEFTWVHPVTQESKACRIIGVYTIAPDGIDFTVSFTLEIPIQ